MPIIIMRRHLIIINGVDIVYSDYDLNYHKIVLSKFNHEFGHWAYIATLAIETIVLHSTYSYIKDNNSSTYGSDNRNDIRR